MSEIKIEGQTALVTGASRGIGAAIAAELGRRGYQVVGTATTDEGAARITQALGACPGSRGVRLSGGQQARTALARTLSHAKPLIVLDDPFAALDRNTEEEIFRELKAMSKDRIIMLISHRLYLFDQTDQVIWMENGQTQTGTHEKMLQIVPEYANLCKVWKEGADHA